MSTKDAIALAVFIASALFNDAADRRRRGTPRYISDELHHMVGRSHPDNDEGNFELLKTILRSGWVSCDPPTPGWGPTQTTTNLAGRLADETFVRAKVTCYCDIPREALDVHISKYGSFGISLSRWQMAFRGARPVIYIPTRRDDWAGAHAGGTVLADIEASYRGLLEHLCTDVGSVYRGRGLGVKPASAPEAAEMLRSALALRVLSFIKPFNSHLDERDPKYYYSEREWRMLGSMEANPSTVSRVIVARGFFRRARLELPDFADRIVFAPKRRR